jgi:hypothetical protein
MRPDTDCVPLLLLEATTGLLRLVSLASEESGRCENGPIGRERPVKVGTCYDSMSG